MKRRAFLAKSAALGSVLPLGLKAVAQNYSDYSKDPRPDVAEGTLTAGSADGPIFAKSPVVMGPAAESITILQPIERHAIGYLEYAVEDGAYQRVDMVAAFETGLQPLAEH